MSAPVAVAVVSWNTRELLRRCLRSLEPDREAGLAEVWVVDNDSSDGSAEMVRSEFPQAHLLEPGRNLGFGPAVNAVAERSDLEWIAPANADIELEPGALQTLLERGSGEPGIAAVAPRLITPDGATQHSVHCFPTVALSFALYSGLGALPGLGDRLCIEGRWDPDRPRRVDWAHGAFLVVRREAFDAVGRFDPGQWMYAEDLDLAWRLRGAGYGFGYEPRARVRHAGSAAAIQAFGEQRSARYMSASYSWMERRRGRLSTGAFAAVNVIGSALRWALVQPRRLLGSPQADRLSATYRAYLSLHARGLRAFLRRSAVR